MALCKVSAALFLIRLSTTGSHTRPGYAVVALTVVWGVASMIVVGLRGKLDSPWSTVDGSADMVRAYSRIDFLYIANNKYSMSGGLRSKLLGSLSK